MYAILKCLNLKHDSEVLVSNYTMVATANIVEMAGLRLKLVDIAEQDLCMCPIDLKNKISKNKGCHLHFYERKSWADQ